VCLLRRTVLELIERPLYTFFKSFLHTLFTLSYFCLHHEFKSLECFAGLENIVQHFRRNRLNRSSASDFAYSYPSFRSVVSRLSFVTLVPDWGGVGGGMSTDSKPRVQLFADSGDGWLHSALRYHQLMLVSCHLRDCNALLVMSLTHVRSAI